MSSLFTASKIRTFDFSIDFCIFFINFSIGCSISAKSKYVEEYLQSFCIKASTQDVLMGVLGSFPASEFSSKIPFTNIVLLTTILPESGYAGTTTAILSFSKLSNIAFISAPMFPLKVESTLLL